MWYVFQYVKHNNDTAAIKDRVITLVNTVDAVSYKDVGTLGFEVVLFRALSIHVSTGLFNW